MGIIDLGIVLATFGTADLDYSRSIFAVSEFVRTHKASFVSVNRSIRYEVTFELSDELPDDAYVDVSMQNPGDPERRITHIAYTEPADNQITVESPAFNCVAETGNFDITVDIYTDNTMTSKLGTHTQLFEIGIENDSLQALEIDVCVDRTLVGTATE